MEHENKLMKDELKIYAQNEKTHEFKLKNLERNEENLKRENLELKKNSDFYLKQNSAYVKDIERIRQHFNTEKEQEREIYENKIINLENTIAKQKKQLSLAESKALEMVRKQQEISEKYKTELRETIQYYENLYGAK